MRLACDTGGTFTDLLVEEFDGSVRMYKASTTPANPIDGVIAVLELAAGEAGLPLDRFLASAETLIHGTTHAINAIVTGNTARTALLTTQGHPDVLVLREGGRRDAFDHETPFPAPYVPRRLTYEIPERIDATGEVVMPLDESSVQAILARLRDDRIEAIACCLLWSISNPVHELRVGQLIEQILPGIPYTLSHQLNPSLREYRRAISAAIDVSLKPLMARYLRDLRSRLRDAGFAGRLLVQTSQGGMASAETLARTPIHTLNSGPALAPVAGQALARHAMIRSDIIVADTGGTTYDVSLVRGGRIPMTRDTWLGQPYQGHMTGFPSIDVKSIGAGGGSIAWLDDSGLLHVGPRSSGAKPGPACFGLGGIQPTLTDAAVLLGYLDPGYFLGGTMTLDRVAAELAIDQIAAPLNVTREAAALAIHQVATENMVQAILDITVRQGIDPAETVLIGGGGAAGINSDAIGRRLHCQQVIFPGVGAALSAAGALLSDIRSEARRTRFCSTSAFSMQSVNALLDELVAECHSFATVAGAKPGDCRIGFSVEARYPNQVWEIDVPLDVSRFNTPRDVRHLCERFHATHRALFGFDDPHSDVEVVTWCATISWAADSRAGGALRLHGEPRRSHARSRAAWFAGHSGPVATPVMDLGDLAQDTDFSGPALIESRFTTIVVQPGSDFRLDGMGLSLTSRAVA